MFFSYKSIHLYIIKYEVNSLSDSENFIRVANNINTQYSLGLSKCVLMIL